MIADDLRQRAAARCTYQPIPDARGLPLIGAALGMNGDLQEFVSGLYRDYGPICRTLDTSSRSATRRMRCSPTGCPRPGRSEGWRRPTRS